jgi:hypothetical protein
LTIVDGLQAPAYMFFIIIYIYLPIYSLLVSLA